MDSFSPILSPKSARKGISKMVTVLPAHIAMIERLMAVKGIVSASEVFRQALVFFYEDKFKDYIDKPKKQKMEQDALAKLEQALLPNNQYVFSLGGLVYKNAAGEKFAVFADWGNCFRAYPLDGIRESIEKDPIILMNHKDGMATIDSNGSNLQKEFEESSVGLRQFGFLPLTV